MNLPPHLYPDLPPENVYGHRRKVECLRASIDGLRTPQRPSLRILDAGCGSGHAVTRYLARGGDRVVGLDMYPPAIDYAQRHFGSDELRFVCADLGTLPASDSEYDVVVLADVLEHLDDPLVVLKSAVDRLAPGGLLLASVPNGRGPFEIESAIARLPIIGPALLKLTDLGVALLNKTVLRGVWSRHIDSTPSDLPYNEESGHVQFFTLSRFQALLAQAGLQPRHPRALSFLCGPFTNYGFAPFGSFCRWNVAVASRLPLWSVSAWYVECDRADPATGGS